jgi:long-chain acyl-CoA synthetase
MTFREAIEATAQIGCGLKMMGLKQQDKLTLFASTCRDWMLVAHSCFSQNIAITTAYDSLGEEGLAYGMNQADVSTLFTQVDLFSVVKKVSSKVESLKNVIYTGVATEAELTSIKSALPNLSFYSVEEVRQLGIANPSLPNPPTPSDIACIMYTSGSTGNPKGVMLTHANVVAAVAGAQSTLEVTPHDVYLGYLPLAHILEFTSEHTIIYNGGKIGYGSPRTLVDSSVRNCKGDLGELRPTIMAGVPAGFPPI